MLKVLQKFQEVAKKSQLYIELRQLEAMIYCTNDKRGCYTGFLKPIPKMSIFDSKSFIKKHSLAGPDSITLCHIQKDGPFAHTELVKYRKSQPICQIPGFKYGFHCANSLKRPEQWSDELLEPETLQLITLGLSGSIRYLDAADPGLAYKVSKRNPYWL